MSPQVPGFGSEWSEPPLPGFETPQQKSDTERRVRIAEKIRTFPAGTAEGKSLAWPPLMLLPVHTNIV